MFSVDCPGTQSEDAGKASACAGCPNQNICASGKKPKPNPRLHLTIHTIRNLLNL